MRFFTMILLVAGLAGGYHWWHGRSAQAATSAENANGFVAVEMPDGANRNAVLVLAPRNCPSAQAQRAEALVAGLEQQGIPVVKGDTMSFDIVNPSAEQQAGVERAVAVFNEGAPAVFIAGMAMSNPTTAQATSEYRRSRH
jgi:hypothetical protein